MESKKISFSFTKTKKAEKLVNEEKKDYIECVEEKSIKVVGGEEIKEITPLIIPMKPNTLVTAERLKEIAQQVESALEEPENVDKPSIPLEPSTEYETLDQMAVRELLQDSKKESKVETPLMTVPLPAKPVNEGEKESTLDDYEAVPIQDFGMAMLRGMGWTQSKENSKYKPPQLRPKGLGLGADKVVKDKQKQKTSKDGEEEELSIVKNAYVKISNGKYSGYYGKVVSLDEDNGRVMVDIAVKKETVSLGEFMMHPVTKAEFDKESKVINANSFEDYKKKESSQKSLRENNERSSSTQSKDRNIKDVRNREASSSKSSESRVDKERSDKNGRDRNDRHKEDRETDKSYRSKRTDSIDKRSSRKKDKRYSSNESLESLSDTERERHKKKQRKRYSSQDSLSSQSDSDRKRNKKKEKKRGSSDSESDPRNKKNKSSEGKRDIDKKRKGKKKKRDRDRSPNYRKHRK